MSSPRFLTSWSDVNALAAMREAWHALAQSAIEPNPFYGPDFLLAAQRHLHPEQRLRCLIVRDSNQGGRLCALLPLEPPHWRDGVLMKALSLYRNAYTCLTTPLVRAQDADDILVAVLRALGEVANHLIVPMIPERRALNALVERVALAQNLPFARVDGRARPTIETRLSAESYRAMRWKKDTRASDRRRHKRLSERGSVTYRIVTGGDADANAALEAFLALEAKGWKGKAGTALAATLRQLAFAHDAFKASGKLDGACFEILALDGQPIAINLSLIAQNTGYALKSAYDEDFAAYGVGTLLDGYSLGLCRPDGPLERLNSCTSMRHPIHQRWCEVEPIGRYLLALKPGRDVARRQRWLAAWGPYGLWRGFD